MNINIIMTYWILMISWILILYSLYDDCHWSEVHGVRGHDFMNIHDFMNTNAMQIMKIMHVMNQPIFIYLFIYLFIFSFIYSFIYLFIYLFIYSFIYLFIYLFIHLFNSQLSNAIGQIWVSMGNFSRVIGQERVADILCVFSFGFTNYSHILLSLI